MLHEPSIRCSKLLVSDLRFEVASSRFARKEINRNESAMRLVWELARAEGVPLRWADAGTRISDPILAAYWDTNAELSAALNWRQTDGARRLNRDNLTADGLEVYERKMGEIAHWIRKHLG